MKPNKTLSLSFSLFLFFPSPHHLSHLTELHKLQLRRVEPEEPEVVHGIVVQRAHGNLLAVEEDRLRGDWPRSDDVAVGEDDAARGVDDEAGGVGGAGVLGVEGARLGDSVSFCEFFFLVGVEGGGERKVFFFVEREATIEPNAFFLFLSSLSLSPPRHRRRRRRRHHAIITPPRT